MPVFFIISVRIPTSDEGEQARGEYDDYIRQVMPIVESFGGQYLVRSESITHITGGWKPDRVVVICFPDRTALDACFLSPQYLAISGLRANSVKTSAIIVDDTI